MRGYGEKFQRPGGASDEGRRGGTQRGSWATYRHDGLSNCAGSNGDLRGGVTASFGQFPARNSARD
jgi:hypothetical protein